MRGYPGREGARAGPAQGQGSPTRRWSPRSRAAGAGPGYRRRSGPGPEPGRPLRAGAGAGRGRTALERGAVPAPQSHYGAFLEGVDAAPTPRTSARATWPTSARTSAGRRSCSARRSPAAARRAARRVPLDTFVAGFAARRSRRPTTRSLSPASSRRLAPPRRRSRATRSRSARPPAASPTQCCSGCTGRYLDTLAELVGR